MLRQFFIRTKNPTFALYFKLNKSIMGKGFFHVPTAINEPIKSYAPGTSEREEVLEQYRSYFNGSVDVPLYIGSEEIKTGNTKPMSPPHDHKHIVGQYHVAEKAHVTKAIDNCLASRSAWADLRIGKFFTASCWASSMDAGITESTEWGLIKSTGIIPTTNW